MPEFMHEIVRRRESRERSSVMTQVYNDLISEMSESYRRISAGNVDARGREAIDRYMSTNNPSVGMNMEVPMLDINARAGTLSTTFTRYIFTGEALETYRGWVRVN